MKKFSVALLLFFGLLTIFLSNKYAYAEQLSQQPTVALPTVTGTPKGVMVSVNLNQEEAINVRSGPSTLFDIVGQLLPGQSVPAFGRSKGGDWIYVEYFGGPENKGWVYAPLVNLTPGELPIVEPPPSPTLEVTQTVNPTLAAQFITTPNPTRLSTYTPVTPLVIATYQDVSRVSILGRIPMGLVILILGGMGGLLAIFSYIRAR
jgi:hypothetical protein